MGSTQPWRKSIEETETPEKVPKVPNEVKRKKIEEDVDKANIMSKFADGHTAKRKKVEESVKIVGHPKTI